MFRIFWIRPCYPLVAGILDLALLKAQPTEAYLRWVARVLAIHFTTASLAITFIWHQLSRKSYFCKQQIAIKQPWNLSVEIKFAVVKFLLVLIFVDTTGDENCFDSENFWNYSKSLFSQSIMSLVKSGDYSRCNI